MPAPPVGTIRNFFKPYLRRKEEEFDGDEIVVITKAAPATQTKESQPPSAQSERSQKNESHFDQPSPARAKTPEITLIQASQHSPLSVRTAKVPVAPTSTAETTKTVTSSFSSNTSKRVTVNGIRGVTNSDDDSDELEDFTAFLPRKRLRMTPPSASAKVPQTAPRPTHKSIMAVSRKPARYSLSDLLQQKDQEESTTARIKQIEADFERADNSKIKTAELLGGDNNARFIAAIDRTEASEEPDKFHFFKSAEHNVAAVPPPSTSISFATVYQQEASLRSGFLEDIADELADSELTTWLKSRARSGACHEEACLALNAICQVAHPSMTAGCLLRDAYSIRESVGDNHSALPSNLKQHLRLVQVLADDIIASDSAVQAITELVLLNLDDTVRQDVELQREIEYALDTLIASGQGSEATAQQTLDTIIGSSILTPLQTAQAIALLPAATLNLHYFRRRLALQYLLDSPSDGKALHDLNTGKRLLSRLYKHPVWHITTDTDWQLFFWLVHILDIAIDAGFSDFTFLDDAKSEEQRLFDEQVDKIAARLRLIVNTIRDSGASNLRRIEAKSALDGLITRLELTVRTTPKPKRDVFGGQSNLMSFMS